MNWSSMGEPIEELDAEEIMFSKGSNHVEEDAERTDEESLLEMRLPVPSFSSDNQLSNSASGLINVVSLDLTFLSKIEFIIVKLED